jgi:hypothetical protein
MYKVSKKIAFSLLCANQLGAPSLILELHLEVFVSFLMQNNGYSVLEVFLGIHLNSFQTFKNGSIMYLKHAHKQNQH